MALSRMFALAVKRKRLPRKPFFPLLEEPDPREGFVTPADFKVIREELPEWLKDPIEFLYITAWRVGEMKSLERKSVDLREGTITLRRHNSKNKKPRILPLRGRLLEIIENQWNKRQDLACTRVFTRNGKPIRDFRRVWTKAANLPGTLVHDLRRSGIKNLISSGVPEKVAMEVSGHRTHGVFERYHIVSADDIAKALENHIEANNRRTVADFARFSHVLN